MGLNNKEVEDIKCLFQLQKKEKKEQAVEALVDIQIAVTAVVVTEGNLLTSISFKKSVQ